MPSQGRLFAGSRVARVVAVAGLRDAPPSAEGRVREVLAALVAAEAPEELRVGGARGIDTIALRIAAELGVPRRVVYAPATAADLPSDAKAALACATAVVELGGDPRHKGVYLARNRAMLAGVDVLLAFTDGRAEGGTAHAIRAAERLGVDVRVTRL